MFPRFFSEETHLVKVYGQSLEIMRFFALKVDSHLTESQIGQACATQDRETLSLTSPDISEHQTFPRWRRRR